MADAMKSWLAKELVGIGLFLGAIAAAAVFVGVLIVWDKLERRARRRRGGRS